MTQRFDQDLVETLNTLTTIDVIKKGLNFVKDALPESIEVQKELALIEAPSYHEEEKAKRYAELLIKAGLEEVRICTNLNVYGFIRGSGNTGRAVVLEGHLDTVFDFGSVKGVTTDSEGRIHCPGICDDTRALVANLSVLKAIKTLNIRPVHDIVIAGTVCEEGLGGMKGIRALLDDLKPQTHVLASISIDGPTGNVFYANATGMVDWSVTFEGPGGHAWTACGTPSAVQAACRAAAIISDIELPDNPKTTSTVSLIEGGQAIHGIAQKAVMKINMRSNDQEELEKLNEKMIAAFEKGAALENARYGKDGVVKVTYEKELSVPAGSQPDDARIIQVAKLVTQACGLEPELKKGGCTNANMPIFDGIPAITYGRGGKEYGTHTLAEWFDPTGVEVCEQKSFLTLLLLAGVENTVAPLGETLKS